MAYDITLGTAAPLGATLVEGGINIAVVSRHATRIDFCLFDARGESELVRLTLPGRSGDVFHGRIAGIGEGARYGFRADGPDQPAQGHRFDPAKLLVDPYAVEIDRPFVFHPDLERPRSERRDTAALVPKAVVRRALSPVSHTAPGDLGLIYELQVKAFTKLHPAVPEALRGTVAALAEPTVIAHLKRIGVGTVELMPLAAWIGERHLSKLGLANAWGYNPVTFLAPDPRLAPGGMAEIRKAVAALKAAGLRVLLDVVLNHTGEADDSGSTLSLRGLDNALYYRHAADDPGRPINDTGCGNTLALDRAPVMRLAMDALRHWARAGIDGFRFDLAPVMGRIASGFTQDAPLLGAIAQDPELSGLVLIAEPWDVGPGGYQLGSFPEPWGEWNDHYRDGVRSFWRGEPDAAGPFATRLAGSSDIFEASHRGPSRSVNFVAAHDGFALADLVAYGEKHNDANGEGNRDGTNRNLSWNGGVEGPTGDSAISAARKTDVRALIATLLLSRGTPMLSAGDEFGRTQQGNNNAYAQDNTITWLDWAAADQSLIEFTGRLAAFRAGNTALTADRFLTGTAHAAGAPRDAVWLKHDGTELHNDEWREPAADVLGLALYEPPSVPGGAGDRLCLWFNRTQAVVEAMLPALRPGRSWSMALASTGDEKAIGMTLASGRLTLPARSVVVCQER